VSTQSPVYLSLNLIGTATLAAIAVAGGDWGFLLLNGVWAIVSAWSLLNLGRRRPLTLEP
jgi:hypothetical protein